MTATIAAVRGRVSELDRRVASGAVAGGLPSLAALYLLTLRTDPLSMSPDMVSVTSSAWQLAHHGTPRLRRRVCLQLMDHSLRTRVRGQQSRAGIDRLGGRVLLTAAVHRDPEPRTGVARSRTPHRRRNGDARVGAALPGARTGGADRGVDRGNGDYHLGVSSASLWPHGPDQLYLAVAMLGLAAEREAWAGVAFAAALLTRLHRALLLVAASHKILPI